MKFEHPFLHSVDPGNSTVPVCYDRLQSWIDRLPGWLTSPEIPNPRATLLCGLPGCGKGNTAKAIASALQRPLYRLDPACDAFALAEILTLLGSLDPCVLWIENPGEAHVGLLRWLLDREHPVFVVCTTDRPHRLPVGFTSRRIFCDVWHLDLPGMQQRSYIWRDLLTTRIEGHHLHDSVRLAQVSSLFTPGEIHEAYDDALRQCGKTPDEGALIDSILKLRPIANELDEELARMRAWTANRAAVAASLAHSPSGD